MEDDPRIEDLLILWEENGCRQSAEELCSEAPELLEVLQTRMRGLLRVNSEFIKAVGTPEGPAAPPTVEGYEILERLGEGGMGVVWRAVQLSTRRQVALKLISRASSFATRTRLRFKREVDLTARLQHPHIARVYDGGQTRDGVYFYAMELIDGQALDAYVRWAKLNRRQILGLMKTVCEAVQYAHQNGVIHRDLKPSNIMVGKDGQPHVLDFGLAKATAVEDGADSQLLTIEGALAGTPAYMSPEQAAGGQVDTRSDVYTLGVILFHLLTGQFPHDTTGSHIQIIRRIIEEEPKRLSSIEPRPDRDLEALLCKALSKDRDRRYATGGALAADLGRYLEGEPVEAQPPTLRYVLAKRLRRHRLAAVLAVGVSLLLGGMFIWSYVRVARERNQAILAQDGERRQRAVAESEQTISKESASLAKRRLSDIFTRDGIARLDSGRPAEALLCFVESLKRDEQLGDPVRERITRTRIGATLRTIPRLLNVRRTGVGKSGWYFSLHFGLAIRRIDEKPSDLPILDGLAQPFGVSPNGRWLVAMDMKGKVCLWEMPSGKLVTELLPDDRFGTFSNDDFKEIVVFSPDSSSILFNMGHSVFAWNTTLTRPAVITRELRTKNIAFNKSGTRILIVALDEVRLLDAGNLKVIMRLATKAARASFSPNGEMLLLSDGERASVWDALSGKATSVNMVHGGIITSLGFSRDGSRIVTGSSNTTARVWNAITGAPLTGQLAHDEPVVKGCFSFDGEKLLTATATKAQVWAVATGIPLTRSLECDPELAQFSPGGTRLVTATKKDKRTYVWNLEEAAWMERGPDKFAPRMLLLESDTPGRIYFSHDDSKLLDLSKDGKSVIIDSSMGMQGASETLIPHIEADGYGTYFTDEGTELVATSYGGVDSIWDTVAERPITLPPLSYQIESVSFGTNVAKIATAGSGGVRTWDPGSGKRISAYPRPNGDPFQYFKFSRDGTQVVMYSAATARVLDMVTGNFGPTMAHPFSISSIDVSHDGTKLLTASEHEICVWDLKSGRRLSSLSRNDTSLVKTLFSPDGKLFWFMDSDSQLRVFDSLTCLATTIPLASRELGKIVTGRQIDALRMDEMDLDSSSAEFSTDSRFLLSYSGEHARIRDGSTGQAVSADFSFEHLGESDGHSFSRDASMVVGAAQRDAHSMRVWEVRTGQAVTPLLETKNRPSLAIFNPDATEILAQTRGEWTRYDDNPIGLDQGRTLGVVAIWDISPDRRPARDLQALAELLSMKRMDDMGSTLGLTVQEYLSHWEFLYAKYPQQFTRIGTHGKPGLPNPVDPGNEPEEISAIRKTLSESPSIFDWKSYEELRRFYSHIDEKKYLYYCDLILQNRPMDERILEALYTLEDTPVRTDTQRIDCLLSLAGRYPEFQCLVAACYLRASALLKDTDPKAAEGLRYFIIDDLKGDRLVPYQTLAHDAANHKEDDTEHAPATKSPSTAPSRE